MRSSSLERTDVAVLWGGILFSFLFTAVIWWAGRFLTDVRLLPDQGPSWYYWQLPEPTFWTRATSWGGYILHQVAIWGTIFYAQKHVKRYTSGLHAVNIAALSINVVFILFHFVQTHIWYDGLAQDTSIFTSQGSVILLLVWVLLMENKRRGMFFGKPLPIWKDIIQMARKYHGYVFSWAIIYTFWFHPMESTSGHLIGFLYTFLLLLQGSLFFTRIHVNRWWMVTQELLVLVHGTMVAYMQYGMSGFWPMFFFGFFGIFVITQMHGLGLSRAMRWVIGGVYIGSVLLVYNGIRGWENLDEIIRVPLIEYALVLVLAGIIALLIGIARLLTFKRRRPMDEPSAS